MSILITILSDNSTVERFTCVLLLGTIILRMVHDMLRYLSLQDIQRINRLSSVYIEIRVWLRLT